MKVMLIIFLLVSLNVSASNKLINGLPAGKLFRGVGKINFSCTITKVGPRQFITAAHCISGKEKFLSLSFQDFNGIVKVKSVHLHPTWIKDCSKFKCTGKEVGGPNMTPGRSDVALFNVKDDTPKIPVVNVRYSALSNDTEVAMVGAGCTRGIEPGGKDNMRYAITKTISPDALTHEKSLYKNISEVTGQSNWVTPGLGVGSKNASLCPGDSGGPLLTKNQDGEWEICGVAADYTFDGPYQDGAITITNLHTRLDDESLSHIGGWIREVWE